MLGPSSSRVDITPVEMKLINSKATHDKEPSNGEL